MTVVNIVDVEDVTSQDEGEEVEITGFDLVVVVGSAS